MDILNSIFPAAVIYTIPLLLGALGARAPGAEGQRQRGPQAVLRGGAGHDPLQVRRPGGPGMRGALRQRVREEGR